MEGMERERQRRKDKGDESGNQRGEIERRYGGKEAKERHRGRESRKRKDQILRGRDRCGHAEEGTEEGSNRGGEMEGERGRNLNINMNERGTQ